MRYYYLLASLPPLSPNFQKEPPIFIKHFWNKIKEEDFTTQEIIKSFLLYEDIFNILRAYNKESLSFQVIIPQEYFNFKEKINLKDFLPPQIQYELEKYKWEHNIWNIYYEYFISIIEKYSLENFQEWIEWDINLKYMFFQKRTQKKEAPLKKLSLFSNKYSNQHEKILDSYYKAKNPLEAEILLDKARWDKISQLVQSYSFNIDEIIAYALHLLILERWWKISKSKIEIFGKVINGK